MRTQKGNEHAQLSRRACAHGEVQPGARVLHRLLTHSFNRHPLSTQLMPLWETSQPGSTLGEGPTLAAGVADNSHTHTHTHTHAQTHEKGRGALQREGVGYREG